MAEKEFSPYEYLKSVRFFCYSGDDGDLYRHNKLNGIRISLYPDEWRIQTKGNFWRGHQYWVTKETYLNTNEGIANFKQDIGALIRTKVSHGMAHQKTLTNSETW